MKVLLVAEGSGGHLIPALQVADSLAKAGAVPRVWYANRQQLAPLVDALAQDSRRRSIEIDAICVRPTASWFGRLSQCRQLWSQAEACFNEFRPDVVVGFGGWISAPVLLAARRRGIGCVVHEQNVVMGKANRLLSPLAQRVAVSFPQTGRLIGRSHRVITGMPVRSDLGTASRALAAQRFALQADKPTLLILGGSQGSRVLNQLMADIASELSNDEKAAWQFVHVTGASDADRMKAAYHEAAVRAWSGAFVKDMDSAYALADIVLARAGASTLAELARCGKPAILIPFPHAGGHQRANAQVAESAGAAVLVEESHTSSAQILGHIRRIFLDAALRQFMAHRMQTLNSADAAQRLAEEIFKVARENQG